MARICVIRQHPFPPDVRVGREVGALCAAGHEVDVICERVPGQPRTERLGPVTIRRLPLRHQRGGTASYVLRYGTFLAAAGALVSILHLRRRYDVVQVNSLPDVLVFAALIPRLTGTPVLLDLHEAMPEFFATKFGSSLDHPVVRLLARLEQASIAFSTRAVTCNREVRRLFVGRGAPEDKIDVVHNSADEAIFDASLFPPGPRQPGRFTLVCHGTLEAHYGVDTVIRAVALLEDTIPGLRLEVYGDGPCLTDLRRLAAELGLDGRVSFSGRTVPVEDMPGVLANADAGVVALTPTPHGEIMQTNKMFELITMRRPAIVSRTRTVERYFGDSCFELFTPGDERDLARAIVDLYSDPDRAVALVERAAAAAEPYRWSRDRSVYLTAVNRLLTERNSGDGSRIPLPS